MIVFLAILIVLSIFSEIIRLVCVFTVVCLVIGIPLVFYFDYLMYLNYAGSFYGSDFIGIYFFCGILGGVILKIFTENVFLHVFVQLLIVYVILRLEKIACFDLPEPRPEDFEN